MTRRLLLAVGVCCALWLVGRLHAGDQVAPETLPLAPEAREAPPDANSQSKKMKVIEDVYKKDLAAARDPRAKVILSKKLLTAAAESKDDRPAAFALLTKAQELAASAGDIEATFAAVDELNANWQTDALAMKVHALGQLSKSGLSPAGVLPRAQETEIEAISFERFDLARKLADISLASAREARDPKLMKTAQLSGAYITQAQSAQSRMQKAATTLEKNPQDAAANLEVGRYRCFFKCDWAGGLRNLADGNDPADRAAAAKDIADNHNPQMQLEIADSWWDLAQKEVELARQNIERHAAALYSQCAGRLTGLNKAKAEQRIASVGAAPATGGWVDIAMPANASHLTKSGEVTDLPEGFKLGPASGSLLATAEELTPPFKVEFLANLDTTHLHIGYAHGYIILNQETNPDDLRFADPASGAETHFANAGRIDTGSFVKVRVVVTDKSAQVVVDGKSRGQITGDYSGCKSRFSIETRFGAIVIVKSFKVQGLPDSHS